MSETPQAQVTCGHLSRGRGHISVATGGGRRQEQNVKCFPLRVSCPLPAICPPCPCPTAVPLLQFIQSSSGLSCRSQAQASCPPCGVCRVNLDSLHTACASLAEPKATRWSCICDIVYLLATRAPVRPPATGNVP